MFTTILVRLRVLLLTRLLKSRFYEETRTISSKKSVLVCSFSFSHHFKKLNSNKFLSVHKFYPCNLHQDIFPSLSANSCVSEFFKKCIMKTFHEIIQVSTTLTMINNYWVIIKKMVVASIIFLSFSNFQLS